MKIYIGYDPRDENAYQVAVRSIHANQKISSGSQVVTIPLKDWELRQKRLYSRPYRVGPAGQMSDLAGEDPAWFSTQFSFTRFLVPCLENYRDEWVLFIDADMMFRADVAELFALADDRFDVMCVQHDHKPTENLKMDGVRQCKYHRKNWSSVMLIKPSGCLELTSWAVNNWSKEKLHSMDWAANIGDLPLEWNYLAGYSTEEIDPKNVHFTRGTPDMQKGGHAPSTKWDVEWWGYLDDDDCHQKRFQINWFSGTGPRIRGGDG